MVRRTFLLSLLAGGLAGQGVPDDPVVKARALRTSPGDLPPVPRGVVEPPPLPPPETHPKDLPGAKHQRRGRKGKAARGRRGGGKTAAQKRAHRKQH